MMHFQRPAFFFFSDLSILYYNESYIATKTKKDTPAPTCVPLGKWLDQYGNVVSKRKKQNRHVCRLGFENPAVADLFYLRLFLHNARSRSFASLRTIEHPQNEPTVRQTFPAAARARGLVTGYEEQSICMQEATNIPNSKTTAISVRCTLFALRTRSETLARVRRFSHGRPTDALQQARCRPACPTRS